MNAQLFVVPRSAPSPVTITGTIVDSSGNPASSGYVDFNLQPASQALPYSVLPDIIVAAPTRARIVTGGQMVSNLDGTSPFQVWPNDLILPSNSLYQVVIAPRGRVTRVLNGVLIESKTNPQSLASLTYVNPQNQVVGTIVNGSPLVTLSVVPIETCVWTVGDPLHYYAAGYFCDLWVDNLYVSNSYTGPGMPVVPPDPGGPVPYTFAIDSSNMFGQPQPNQVVLLWTCFVQTVFPPNFANPTSYGHALTNPQSPAVYTIMKNSNTVGTVSVAPGGVWSFSTSGFTCNPGDILWATAPNPMDPLLSDAAFSLVGTRTS